MTHLIDYGRWRSLAGYGHFAARRPDVPLVVQFSGGRTSGFMTCMAPDDAMVAFENTGREHEKTLEFVRDVGDALGREVVWLEFRPPKTKGAAPREFGWERVDFKTAARHGEPFAEFMRCINEYRAAKREGIVSPWAKARICTVHVKHRVLDHYLRDLDVDAHDRWIGLRADEPVRVAGLHKQNTIDRGLLAPLSYAGVTKAMVNEFWARQSFDLGIDEYDGNCDGCFLKDEADLARAIGARPEAIEWWGAMNDAYPRFGGESHKPYRMLAAELPARLAIETALRSGGAPPADVLGNMNPKRFRLVVAQERKRIANGPAAFSCACEGSMHEEPEYEFA